MRDFEFVRDFYTAKLQLCGNESLYARYEELIQFLDRRDINLCSKINRNQRRQINGQIKIRKYGIHQQIANRIRKKSSSAHYCVAL